MGGSDSGVSGTHRSGVRPSSAPARNRVVGPVRARAPCRAALRACRRAMDMCVGRAAWALRTQGPKLDLSARTFQRGALLERWLAQFWNEVGVYTLFTA